MRDESPANHWQRWSADEITRLHFEFANLRGRSDCVQLLALSFGRTQKAIRKILKRQRLHLTRPGYPANHGRRWSAAEITRLHFEFADLCGRSDCVLRLGLLFNRTPLSIRGILERQGLHLNRSGYYLTLRQAAGLTGIGESALYHINRRGAFLKQWPPHAKGRTHHILVDSLLLWMERPASWHYWQPDKLPDRAWREHFTELRRDWITTREAANILFLSISRFRTMYRRGYIPGIKPSRQHQIWFKRADVEEVRTHLDGARYIYLPNGRTAARLAREARA